MKRVFLFTLLSVVFALLLTGCGGGGTNNAVTAGAGNATIQTGDATNDQIAKFELTISSITLTGVSPTATTGNLLSKSAEVEFTHQAGTFEPLTLANVPQGTYNGATLTVSGAEIVVINGTTPTKVPATLSSTTVTVSFTNIVVGSSPIFINFDLDLANSVTLNGTPITSATVNPKFNVTSTTTPPAGGEAGEDNDNGEFEVHGSVKSISAPSFTVTTNSTDITVATDSNTQFKDGITQLSDLKVGDIVEVEGITKSDGTKLATKVEREGGQNGEEIEGLISALDNPLTTITIIHQEDSTGTSNSPVTVPVTVNANTVYSVRTDKLNLGGSVPAFDAANIGKGQRIEGDANSSVTPLLATKIKLREQALLGTIAASPAPTASGFTLTLSPTSAFATLSGATSVAVTIPSGANVKVPLTAGATVRVRGLVFFNAGTYSAIAVRVDNNQ
jgi:uncharacterized protein DUF5666